MMTITVTVQNKEGLHARPASLIMQVATLFQSDIYLVVGQERVNAKSIMSLIGVSAIYGSTLTLEASGLDEEAALLKLEELFNDKFGEE